MGTTYQVTRRGEFWYAGNYRDEYYINIECEDKAFIDFMDDKIYELLEEFKQMKKEKQ